MIITIIILSIIVFLLLLKMTIFSKPIPKITEFADYNSVYKKMEIFNTFLKLELLKTLDTLLLSDHNISDGNNEIVIMANDYMKLLTTLNSSNEKDIEFRNNKLLINVYYNFTNNVSPTIINIFYKFYNDRPSITTESTNIMRNYIIDFSMRFILNLLKESIIQSEAYYLKSIREDKKTSDQSYKEFNNMCSLNLSKKINELYNIDNIMDICDPVTGVSNLEANYVDRIVNSQPNNNEKDVK